MADRRRLSLQHLTNLDNRDLTWLRLACQKLDAYGWPHDITDDEILERLLALNLERALGGELVQS